jgi:hypothetical protein
MRAGAAVMAAPALLALKWASYLNFWMRLLWVSAT